MPAARLVNVALLLLPVLLVVVIIAWFMLYVPPNPAYNRPNPLYSDLTQVLIIVYFVVGSVAGTIPIIRARSLTTRKKLLAVPGYVMGALIVLWAGLIMGFATRIVI